MHGLKQRIHYYCQQSATWLKVAKELEKEKDNLKTSKQKLEADKERKEKDNSDLSQTANKLREDLHLKTEVCNTLDVTMAQLK